MDICEAAMRQHGNHWHALRDALQALVAPLHRLGPKTRREVCTSLMQCTRLAGMLLLQVAHSSVGGGRGTAGGGHPAALAGGYLCRRALLRELPRSVLVPPELQELIAELPLEAASCMLPSPPARFERHF